MTAAYYATYTPGHHGARDRVGGLPTHLPREYPTCRSCGKPLVFLMQLYLDDKDLFDEPWLCLHLYECAECLESSLIALDLSAEMNITSKGLPLPQDEWAVGSIGVRYSRVEWGERIEWQDIAWVKRNDPDPTDDIEQFWHGDELESEFAHLSEDKLGGCFPWRDENEVSAKQLGAFGQFSVLRHTTYLFNDPQKGLHFYYY